MFGARWSRLFVPLVKNFLFRAMTIRAISIWVRAMETGFSRKPGTGKPAMECPMERYISSARKPRDEKSRFFSAGVSRSIRASSSGVGVFASPLGLAP